VNRDKVGLWLVIIVFASLFYSNTKFTYQLIYDRASLFNSVQLLYSDVPEVIFGVYISMSVFYFFGAVGLALKKSWGLYGLVIAFILNQANG